MFKHPLGGRIYLGLTSSTTSTTTSVGRTDERSGRARAGELIAHLCARAAGRRPLRRQALRWSWNLVSSGGSGGCEAILGKRKKESVVGDSALSNICITGQPTKYHNEGKSSYVALLD